MFPTTFSGAMTVDQQAMERHRKLKNSIEDPMGQDKARLSRTKHAEMLTSLVAEHQPALQPLPDVFQLTTQGIDQLPVIKTFSSEKALKDKEEPVSVFETKNDDEGLESWPEFLQRFVANAKSKAGI